MKKAHSEEKNLGCALLGSMKARNRVVECAQEADGRGVWEAKIYGKRSLEKLDKLRRRATGPVSYLSCRGDFHW